jgi:hypothetical protein
MEPTERVLVEGLTVDELVNLPSADLDRLLLSKPEIVFSFGTADVLAGVRVSGTKLVVVIGHIDGGLDPIPWTVGLRRLPLQEHSLEHGRANVADGRV